MQIKQAIMGAFLVDSYSLGAHWIYDESELEKLSLDWSGLNTPQAMWHKGKEKGDFTHYGDHTLWLLEFVTQNRSFNVHEYAKFWQEKMGSYDGYIDGSSRETVEHLAAGKFDEDGVCSHDLSICGRIAPLLLVSKTKEDFVSNAVSFAKFTHNDPLVLEAIHFFASMLYSVLHGEDVKSITKCLLPNYSDTLVAWINDGIESKDADTFETIRAFGPACGVEGGFASTVHLLFKYNNIRDMMEANAKAGGDSSARGMIAGMILATSSGESLALAKEMSAYSEIETLLSLWKF